MKRYKFLMFVVIAAMLSCYKIPSKPPQWEIRVNVPIGDSTVTAQEMVDDTSINHKLSIEIDPDYNDTLWTVFHFSDTATGYFHGPTIPGDTILKMLVKEKVANNIDTTKSHFHSLAKVLLTRVYIKGNCSTDFYATVTCSLSPPAYQQHFVPFVETFPIQIAATSHLDTTMVFKIDSFPLGPYRNHITTVYDSGDISIDSAMGYAKMPIDFLSRGDTIITFLKGVEVDEDARTNEDKDLLKRVIVHLVFTNRTSAGFTGNFRIGTRDSSIVWHSHPITVEAAPHDAQGFTTGEPTVTIIEDTLTDEYVSMTDEDSLFWRANLTIPALGKVFLKPDDWLRLYGYVSVDLWFDSESLGEEE